MTLIVNGEKIEDSVIQREVERLRPDYQRVFADQSPEEQKAQLLDWSRENVIERVLVEQEAKKRSGQIPESEIKSALAKLVKQYGGKERFSRELDAKYREKIKEGVELQIRIERLLADACKELDEPSQQDIRQFYEENKEQFKTAERVRVAHIVRYINWQTDEATACNVIKKAKDELKKGELFETVVRKYSDCLENDGDLGYITRGQMVEEFEDVVFNLNVGEESEIFRTRFGFHIARVYDRKPAVVRTLKEVKDRIVSELKEQMRGKAVDEFVDRLKSKAKIEEV